MATKKKVGPVVTRDTSIEISTVSPPTVAMVLAAISDHGIPEVATVETNYSSMTFSWSEEK